MYIEIYRKKRTVIDCGIIFLLLSMALAMAPSAIAVQWQHFEYGGAIKSMVSYGQAVWIGGEAGALRFDAETGLFLRLEKSLNQRGESLQLAGSIVRDIAVDPRGRVWFACWEKGADGLTGAGLTMMDPLGFVSFTEKEGLPSNEIYSLCADPQGRLWAGTKEGVAVCDEGRWTIYTTKDGLYRNDAVEISIDAQGRVWCGFWRGVNAFYDGNWWSWQRKRVDYVYSIVQGKDNKIYCATKGGLAIYDGERWEYALNRGDLRKRLISDMAADNNARIWCAWGGLDKGVSFFDGYRWARITQQNTDGGLVSNYAIAVAADPHGRIWIGDRKGAVSVMIPDGAPLLAQSALMKAGPSRGEAVEIDDASAYLRISEPWAAPFAPDVEPLLIAQTDAKANIKLRSPDGLDASTESAPFEINQTSLKIAGGVAAIGAKLAKLTANGIVIELKNPVDYGFGGPPIYPFEASISLKPGSPIHLEVFNENGKSVGVRDIPVKLLAAELGLKIKIAKPEGLEAASADAPFELSGMMLDLAGGIAVQGNVKLAKLEINGFAAALQGAVDYGFGGPPIYPFETKVLLKEVQNIHIEVFDGEDRSQGFRDYPIKILQPSPENRQPEIRFIKPSVTEEQLIATRGGGGPIEVKMTSANRGFVRGLAQDDTEIKNVLFNGGPVEYLVEASPLHLEEAGMFGIKNAKFFEHRFALLPGDNRIAIQAIDYFDNATEIDFDMTVQQPLYDSMFYGDNYALVVGIDRYPSWRKLDNAVRDAKGMKDLLTQRFQFKADHVAELYDENASLEGIFDALRRLAKVDANSRVIVFFAGHGYTATSSGGEKQGFLIPFDGAAPSGKTRTEAVNAWLSMDRLTREMKQFQAKHILLILDACYSGLLTARRSAVFGDMDDSAGLGFGDENAHIAKYLRLSAHNAIEVVTAGSEDEAVLDGGPGGHSFFTGMLIQGLKSGQADLIADGVITSEELGSYLTREVRIAAADRQHPAYSKLPGFENMLGLVLFSATEPEGAMTSMNLMERVSTYLQQPLQ
ncbi:MAG: caspase family protein [Candidatus Omnitrophota bacterium]